MKILSIAVMLFAFSLVVSAQEKVLTEAEYNDVASQAEKGIYAGTHGPLRQVMETEVLTEGRPEADYRLKSLTLIVPGQGSHRIEDRSFGGKPSKSETITINKRLFTRDASGTWKEIIAKSGTPDEPAKSPTTIAQMTDSQGEYKYLGTETYADHHVRTYLRTERKKTVNTSGTTTESEVATKLRVGVNGDYYRYESNTRNNVNGKPGSIKILIEVIPDPTIKITAPEIPAEVVKTTM